MRNVIEGDNLRWLSLQVDDIQLFVLDEEDEMLSRGFKEQIYDIFKFFPPNVQVALFSATMAPDILDLTSKFMRDPVRILVKKDERTLEGINLRTLMRNTPLRLTDLAKVKHR